MKLIKLLLIIILFVPIRAEFIVKEFSIIDGLIEGSIKDIFQDDIGRIWIMTDVGVSVFDGYDFYTKRYPDRLEINSGISGQCTDDNQCWLLTDAGILKYQNLGLSKKFEYTFYPQHNLNHFIVSGDEIWASANNGTELLYFNSQSFEKLAISKNLTNIVKMIEDEAGHIWIFCSNSIWKLKQNNELVSIIKDLSKKYNGFNCTSILINNKNYLLNDKSNSICLTLKSNGVIEKSKIEIKFENGVIDDNGKIIFINHSKLFSLDNSKLIESNEYNDYSCIFKDRTGSIWLSKANSIWLISDPNITVVNPNKFIEDFDNIISAFISNDKFIFSIDDKDKSVYEYFENNFYKSNIPYFIENYEFDNEYEYLVSPNSSAFLFNKNNNEIIQIPTPDGNLLNVIKSTFNDRVIAKTDSGVYALNDNDWRMILKINSNNKFISSIKDKIYILNHDSLFVVNYVNDIQKFPIPKISYHDMLAYGEDIILVGENNIFSFNTMTKQIEENKYNKYNNFKIQSLKFDKESLWLNCYNYLLNENPESSVIYNFDKFLIDKKILNGISYSYAFDENYIFSIKNKNQSSLYIEPYIYSQSTNNTIEVDYKTDFPLNIRYFYPSFNYLGSIEYYYKLGSKNTHFISTKLNNFSIPIINTEKYIIEVYPKIGNWVDYSKKSIKKINVKLPWYLKYNIILISLFFIIGLLIGAIFYIYYKYIKNSKIDPFIENSYINVFNKFHAIKKSSIGIVSELSSPMHKEMIFYLILFGYKYKNGVDSEKFGTYFWPNLSHKKANNRRNVAFSRIRHIIGTKYYQLIYSKDRKCFIQWDNNMINVDIINYYKNIEKARKYKKEGKTQKKIYYYNNALRIYDTGITNEFSGLEIDKIRLGIHNEAMEITTEIIKYYENKKDFEELLKLCEQRISWDDLDIDIAQIKTNTLIELDRKIEAKRYINLFNENFQNEIGEIPKLDFQLLKLLV